MRKYIHIAKLIKPVLTREAADCIADEYSKLRSQEQAANNVARVGLFGSVSLIFWEYCTLLVRLLNLSLAFQFLFLVLCIYFFDN